MFSIETTEDVKILKELTNSSSEMRIKDLEIELRELSQTNEELRQQTKEQKELIDKLSKTLITADQCRNIVFDLLNGASKPKIIKQKAKRAPATTTSLENEEFTFTETMQRKFNKILIDGNKLIHYTVRNQKMDIPISTIELLALVEIYQKRQRKLLNKDSKNICKLYNITKVQFGKLYYNLKEGVFFNALDEINNQIRKTNFRFQNGTIKIIDGANLIDTKIDSKMFNDFLNIYVNSNQPYATVYKLARENPKINPIHILTILRKNTAVSKTITNG